VSGCYCERCHADHSTSSEVSSRSEHVTDDRVIFDCDEVDGLAASPNARVSVPIPLGGVTCVVA
jgi:hypothetical protein